MDHHSAQTLIHSTPLKQNRSPGDDEDDTFNVDGQEKVSEILEQPPTSRRVIELDLDLLGQSVLDEDINETSMGYQAESVKRVIKPLTDDDLTPVKSMDEAEMRSSSRQWEKLKENKESENRNRQSLISNSSDSGGGGGLSSELDRFYNKSAQGKWKRRKGPAPSLPVPPKRVLQMLPMQEIKHELEVIEVQQQGLEKQGVQLEKMIREKTEGVEGGKSNGDDLDGALTVANKNTSEVEGLIMQLFDLVVEKNELFRRQAELMYLRRQNRLEVEQADLEYEIRVLMAQPECNKTDSDKAKEETLISRLMEVVRQRNAVVDSLEMDRLREAQEDLVSGEVEEVEEGRRMEQWIV